MAREVLTTHHRPASPSSSLYEFRISVIPSELSQDRTRQHKDGQGGGRGQDGLLGIGGGAVLDGGCHGGAARQQAGGAKQAQGDQQEGLGVVGNGGLGGGGRRERGGEGRGGGGTAASWGLLWRAAG